MKLFGQEFMKILELNLRELPKAFIKQFQMDIIITGGAEVKNNAAIREFKKCRIRQLRPKN